MFNPNRLNSEYDYGDLIPIREFIGCVREGGFMDGDGFGHWATETHHDDSDEIYPSMLIIGIPEGVTHMFWFNN